MDWTNPTCSEKITGSGTVSYIPKIECIPVFFAEIVYWAFILAGSLAVVIIIWAGIKYIRSGGDQKQVQSARSTLTFGIVGLIIVLASVFIVNIVAYVSGANCIKRFGFRTCEIMTIPAPSKDTRQ